ncbi:sensor histidine kinase [Dokdonella sp.]|uniref:sensor histidine kinase n=1 Tax=Dokdonella sp. TaxID=2291710 RepID=UPI00352971E4
MRRWQPRLLSRRRLAVFLALLFAGLMIPTVILLLQTQRQIRFEAFHQYRTLAEELGLRINSNLQNMLGTEEDRSYADYQFAALASNPANAKLLQRSPLSDVPPRSELPGLIGYFQVDADGAFSTPALPDDLQDPVAWGLDSEQLRTRVSLRNRLLDVLRQNSLLERGLATHDAKPDRAGEPASDTGSKARKDEVTAASSDTDRQIDGSRESDTLAEKERGMAESAEADVGVRSQIAEKATPNASQNAILELGKVQSTGSRIEVDKIGQVQDLRLERNFQKGEQKANDSASAPAYEQRLRDNVQVRAKRKEQSVAPESLNVDDAVAASLEPARVRMFESELDPFEFSLLEGGYGVLYRKVWRDGQRTIQGAIIDQDAFIAQALVRPFEESALAQMSDMVVAYRNDVLSVRRADGGGYMLSRAAEVQGELLHQTSLSAPLGDFQLLWNVRSLPAGPGGRIITWAGVLLTSVLVLGFLALYRLGLRQIQLARQQQDFVSAVSHELKTPLTSIRMYAEMLREGWPDEARKREYYAFIHDESERLSRLIGNVLQLARLERSELQLDLGLVRVSELADLLRSRLDSQIVRAGFTCKHDIAAEAAEHSVLVDTDAVVQIMINLVDNALKFSARADRREIDIRVSRQGSGQIAFSVRDYGPGVESSQLRKIFTLFYRSGDEMRREAPGTGIGLALVRQLARAMHGEADVRQCEPGAEFVLLLPIANDSGSAARH